MNKKVFDKVEDQKNDELIEIANEIMNPESKLTLETILDKISNLNSLRQKNHINKTKMSVIKLSFAFDSNHISNKQIKKQEEEEEEEEKYCQSST